jgi:signal peptidase I
MVLVLRSGWAVPVLFLVSAGGALALRVIALVDVLKRPPAAVLPNAFRVVAWCAMLAAATVGANRIAHHFARAYRIPAGSMIPTLQVGDHVLAERASHAERGDVIVFRYPKDPAKDFVKRVVAIGGDTVEIRDGVPVVNGQPLPREAVAPGGPACTYQEQEDEAARMSTRPCVAFVETQGAHRYTVIQSQGIPPRSFPKVSVPAGHLYVLGDNRDNSHDSRYWGTVPPENLEGRAFVIWWGARGRIGRGIE